MRSKLKRFAENAEAANVIQPGKPLFDKIKGHWHELYFKNKNPLTVEMACGRGEYTTGLARLFPQRNYVGVDIKGDRIWKGARLARQEGMQNVAFLRILIHHVLDYFAENEVDEIWLTFPDPQPKDRHEKRRLTHPRFLDMYKIILQPDGWLRFKTDNTGLFTYTLEVLQARPDIRDLTYTFDLYESPLQEEHYGITTRYEQMFAAQGEKIKYLKFRFKD